MHYGYPKIVFLGGFMGEHLKCYSSKPKKELPYPETRLLTYSAWKSIQRCGLYPSSRTAKKGKEKIPRRVYISRTCREKPLQPIFTKIGLFQLAPDVITPSKFYR